MSKKPMMAKAGCENRKLGLDSPKLMSNDPQFSIIIPTIGRDSLNRALDSIRSQEISEGSLEVIIVNDSGTSLNPSLLSPVAANEKVLETIKRGQSVARNVGAAAARGRFLLFLDDDDYLEPGALEALQNIISEKPGYTVYYGGARIVNGREETLGVIDLSRSGNCASQMLSRALIQFGSACIRVDDYFAVGGINAANQFGEDIDLFRRLAMIGDFCHTPSVIVNFLRGDGWDSSVDFSMEDLWHSREHILDQKGTYGRLANSAYSAYWHGRLVKTYLASCKWNFRHRHYLKAISRLLFFLRSLLDSGVDLFRPDFRLALREAHVPATPHRVLHTD